MAYAQPPRGWPWEWSGQGRGNRRSQETVWWGALQWLNARNRQPARYSIVERGGSLDGNEHARAADIEMHVQTRLPGIILRPVACRIVVVMVHVLMMAMTVMVMMV